jgi:hypothetical protein
MKEKFKALKGQFVHVYEILIKFKENLPEFRGFSSLKYGNMVKNPSNCTKMPLLVWHLTKVPSKIFSKNIDFYIYIW